MFRKNQVSASLDPKIFYAQKIIYRDYGVHVSPYKKCKTLSKFGRNLTVGTSFETVGEFQGSVSHEAHVSTNLIDTIVSTNAGDVQDINIEGQTIDASGNLTFSVQTATLAGTTPVTLTTPLARATRAYIANSGTFDDTPDPVSGTVSIYDNTSGETAGVPTLAAATKLIISAGEAQSEKCATSISQNDFWLITSFSAGIGNSGGSANVVTVRIQTRDVVNGGAWRPAGREITLYPDVPSSPMIIDPVLIIPSNHDVRVVAKTNANTAEVFAELSGMLAN